MNEVLAPRGSDQEFEITCKDTDGTPFDLSVGYSNIVIIVYNANKTILDKFSVVVEAGWKAIDTTDWAVGKLSFILLTSITNLATEGKKYAEIRLQKTDGTLPDSNFDVITNQVYLCTITKSITSNITLP